VAQRLQFSDATGTPVQSPKTSVGTGGQAFVVPAGAFTFTFRADAAGYVSSSGAFDSSNGYYQFAANTDFVYPCANMAGSSIYIRSVSGSITVYFMFEMGA
jgi:hypothetical protein